MHAKMRCKCGHEFVVDRDKRGRRFRCPDCGKARGIPAAEQRDTTALPFVPRVFFRYLFWPLFVGVNLALTYWAVSQKWDWRLMAAATALPTLVLISTLEWLAPHRRSWGWKDGQFLPNVVHGIISPLAGLFIAAEVIGEAAWPFAKYLHNDLGILLWPQAWPYAAQVVLMVIVWDFFGYWAHRWSHEWGWLWRVHALHHNQPTLHAINAGRIHVLDTLKTEATALPLLLIIGVPPGIIAWYVVFFRAIGVLSHTNIEIRMGVFNYIFNTPEVHRYHHSSVIEEEHSNYGQNFMIWDIIFRTFTKPDTYGPPTLGAETPIPDTLVGQVLSPVVWNHARSGAEPTPKKSARRRRTVQPAAATTLS